MVGQASNQIPGIPSPSTPSVRRRRPLPLVGIRRRGSTGFVPSPLRRWFVSFFFSFHYYYSLPAVSPLPLESFFFRLFCCKLVDSVGDISNWSEYLVFEGQFLEFAVKRLNLFAQLLTLEMGIASLGGSLFL